MMAGVVSPMEPLRCLLAAAETAETAFVAEPGTEALQRYVHAWDQVLLALGDDADLGLQAMVAHHAAVGHLEVFRRFGADDHAEIAADLLERLGAHAPSAELGFAATADLATLRFGQYLAHGGLNRLREVIQVHEDALRRSPEGFPQRPTLLTNLGNALVELARRDTTADVLDRAVALHEEAVAGTGPDEPFRAALQVNLATALVTRYQRDGRVADLDWAAQQHDEIAQTGPTDEQVAIARCEVLWERYALSGEMGLLDEIITALGELMAELPEQLSAWATAVANLANALLERQSRTTTPADALALISRALAAAPAEAPERARLHHVQGAAHWQEYLHSGDLSRLGSAIEAWQQAVALLPPGDAARPGYLNSVAVGLLQRHAHFADEPDLAAAVATARRAVRAAPPHSALAPIVWNTLGHTLAARYHRRGRRRDLDVAIDAWRRAVDLSPPRATVRPSYLASLANGLRERAARRTGKPATSDLLAAVALHREATAALAGSQELPGQLANLGMSLHGLAVQTTNVAHYLEASRIFGQAVELGMRMSPGEALRAALAWQAMALDAVPDWPQAAMAGDGALRALWALSAGQMSRFAQETWLRTCIGIAGVTALAHTAASDPRAAVATLESGRGLLLDRALPAGTRLRAEHPELFTRYQAASTAFAAALRTIADPRRTARAPTQPLAGFSGLAGDSKR